MSEKIISKKLTYWLRHGLEKEGMSYTNDGFVNFDDLINKIKLDDPKFKFSKTEMITIIKDDKRGRMTLKENGDIRANYGHSFNVELESEEKELPAKLYLVMANTVKPGNFHIQRKNPYITEDLALSIEKKDLSKKIVLVLDTKQLTKDQQKSFSYTGNKMWTFGSDLPEKALSVIEKPVIDILLQDNIKKKPTLKQ